MRGILCLIAALAVALGQAQSARADITYSLVAGVQMASGGSYTTTNSYSVAPGGSITLNLYLQESLGIGNTSLINGNGGTGLGAGDVTITRTGGSGYVDPTSAPTNNTASTATGGFTASGGSNIAKVYDSTGAVVNSGTTGVTALVATGLPASPQQVPPGPAAINGLVLLGTVTISGINSVTTFNLSSAGGGPQGNLGSQLLADAQQSGGGASITGSTYIIDTSGQTGDMTQNWFGPDDGGNMGDLGNFDEPIINSITITPTPEPSSILLCGFALGGMGLGAWKRRRAKAAAANTTEVAA